MYQFFTVNGYKLRPKKIQSPPRERLRPIFEGQVSRHNQTRPLVSSADDVEQQFA